MPELNQQVLERLSRTPRVAARSRAVRGVTSVAESSHSLMHWRSKGGKAVSEFSHAHAPAQMDSPIRRGGKAVLRVRQGRKI